jgi:hypothetical protein
MEAAGDLARELSIIEGARVDSASANPDTGLLALSLYAGEKRILGVGIGPNVAGIGWLPRLPRLRAGSSHPLVAAIRAHIVGHRVRDIRVEEDGAVSVFVLGPMEGASTLTLVPGRRGEARVYAASGALVLQWPRPDHAKPPAPPALPAPARTTSAIDLNASGAALVEESDRLAAVRAKSALARSVKARLAALARRVEAVRGDLSRLGDVDRLQKIGRLLLAQGSKIPRGAKGATLNDWEAGGAIEIPLDPARPAEAQAEVFFAKARRYQRGEVVMRKRLAEAERALADVTELAAAVRAAPATTDALEPLTTKARSLGVSLARVAPEPGRAARPEERLPYTTYRAEGGSPILVGRGAKDNDALTTKHARPHDLWLHAKGINGAHVIVPLERGTSCPPDTLVDAATLAAHFSDARGEAVCDVSYVERRYVRKPRKSAPGAVVFDREKIIAVRIEPARLERLLASKEDQSPR